MGIIVSSRPGSEIAEIAADPLAASSPSGLPGAGPRSAAEGTGSVGRKRAGRSASASLQPPASSPAVGLADVLAADPAVGEVLLSQSQIAERVVELGSEITADYAGRQPLLVVVLKGATIFAADLARQIRQPSEIDFMAISSYGSSTRSSGVVRILKDLDLDIGHRDVILVEDIVDSGLTLSYLRRSLLARRPASLRICALLVRDHHGEADEVGKMVDYIGFRLPPVWVVGYGLDAGQKYRNIPDIHAYDAALSVHEEAIGDAGQMG